MRYGANGARIRLASQKDREANDSKELAKVLKKLEKVQSDINKKFSGGEEIAVIKGRFIDEQGEYPAGSWLRNPHMGKHFPRV